MTAMTSISNTAMYSSAIGFFLALVVAAFSIFFILLYYSNSTEPLSQDLSGVFAATMHVLSVFVLGLAIFAQGILWRWLGMVALLIVPYFLWIPYNGLVIGTDFGDWLLYAPFLVLAFCLLHVGIVPFLKNKETT